ncbi:hypothetical protein ElyMa_002060300 [Elysia marginata]|uniref:Uncharacterized protein n=1 Tax=Elysia marginata TaxID=1093978 RepID=A0AAV4FA97_9GAST|nr:hypothetical protein ElyMa_002060300 [Elysia marginata]
MRPNVDHNLKTLEGLGTFHGMGIIGAVTSGEKRSRPIRRDTSVNANQISTLGQISVHFYNSSKTEISLSRRRHFRNSIQKYSAPSQLVIMFYVVVTASGQDYHQILS